MGYIHCYSALRKLQRLILYQMKSFIHCVSQNKKTDTKDPKLGKTFICRLNFSTLKIGSYENINLNFKGIKNYQSPTFLRTPNPI